MVRKILIVMSGLVGLAFAQSAIAVNGGLYLGGSFGGATTKVTTGSDSFDDSDIAWKAFGGFHFLQFFAVEATYRDLGSSTANVSGSKIDITAIDVSGLVGLPLGPIFLFGKLGVVDWDADITGSPSEDGTDYTIGIGGSLDLIKIRLRAEVEYFDIGDDALMYTIGAAWLF